MSKESARGELERLVREAMEKKNIAVKKVDARLEAKCGKCGVANKVKVSPGEEGRGAKFTCKECGHRQSAF